MNLKKTFYKILEVQEEIDDLNSEIGELESKIITEMNTIRKEFAKYGIPELNIRYYNEDMSDYIPYLEITCTKEQVISILNGDNEIEEIKLQKKNENEYKLYIEYPDYYR